MTDNKPSLAEWRALYQAADEFKKLAPWQWMWDRDIFGVKNPDDGSIGYCCVMGAGGEHFALGVYLGDQGLAGYLAIQTERLTAKNAIFFQTVLMASFENADLVEKEDREIIRKLELSFRGRNAWPLFRIYEPNFLPWFINSKQAIFLTQCFTQANNIALRFQKKPNLFKPLLKNQVLVREQTPDGTWRDTHINPFPLSAKIPETISPQQPDDKMVERLKKQETTPLVLEIDIFLSASPVANKDGRPFFPYLSLIVEHNSGFVVGFELKERHELLLDFPNLVGKHLEKSPFGLPAKILVKNNETAEAIFPLAKILDIEIELTKKLPALAAAKRSLKQFNAFNLI